MANFIVGVCAVLVFSPLLKLLQYQYLLIISVIAALTGFYLNKRSQKRWRFHCAGFVAPGFEKVEQVFRENIASRQDQGSAFAVYYRGEPVVDLWGGYADQRALRLRKQDSMSMVYSVTKGVTALCMAMLVDRGLLDYKSPVCKYWPEFAENGKEDISVETLLSHQAGLISIREKHKLSLLRDDPDKLGQLLAKQEPFWTPGTAHGYHTLTFGLYADFLLRKVDKQGRTLSQFFRDEIAVPFDVDFHIGAPKTLHYRSCRESRASFGWKFFFTTVIPTGVLFLWRALYSRFKLGTIYLMKLIGNPTDWQPMKLNDPEFRELGCGSSHGYGTTRSLGKLMGILANGGKHNGQTLLTSDTIDRLNKPLSTGFDRVILINLAYGPGTIVREVDTDGLPQRQIFGHWGAGGQVMYCDPGCQLGWAYTTNFSNLLHGFIVDHRYAALEAALFDCVAALRKKQK